MKLSIPNYQPAIVDWNFTRSDSVQYNDLLELTRSRFLQLENSYRKESEKQRNFDHWNFLCIIILAFLEWLNSLDKYNMAGKWQ